MFFAVFKSLANIADSTFLAQFHWSSNIYNMMPFIASMIILAFTSKNSMAPKAEGIPLRQGFPLIGTFSRAQLLIRAAAPFCFPSLAELSGTGLRMRKNLL